MNIEKFLADEFNIKPGFMHNVIGLFKEKATIPFMARYRKEATGGQNETVLRNILERFAFLTELKQRKESVLKTIDEQGRLTDELRKSIETCLEKTKLEDMYLPFKPKRKTRASIARERGLDLLLKRLLLKKGERSVDLATEAKEFVNPEKGVESVEDALKGASDIYAEAVSEKSENRDLVRSQLVEYGKFASRVRAGYKGKKTKFEMYYDYQVPVKKIASHNMLAMRRGEKESVLSFSIQVDSEGVLKKLNAREVGVDSGPVSSFLRQAVEDAYNRLIKLSITSEIRLQKKREADLEAIITFEKNLGNLLLSPPAGAVSVLAIDPGFRTGCKLATLNPMGRFLEYTVIFPVGSKKQKTEAKDTLVRLVTKYTPQVIAIGNGTASRETERFVKDSLRECELAQTPHVLLVSEAGASVYSASESAIKEFPDQDITVRGAISIGRRLINPLAELVKIEPKSIGVGQYQHDVDQSLLKKKLGDVVESCVNFVGVDLNSASLELLSYVSGINATVAGKIVQRVKENGPFKNRREFLSVPGVGAKVFEQASGFLRIKDGDNPLDDSSVHPESYHVVKKIAKTLGLSERELIGNRDILDKIKASEYVDDETGEITVSDILKELKKPGQDPRANFSYTTFDDNVSTLDDLIEGMKLQGVVTNVANFGAFIDIGVHQDGLVHISKLAKRFVKNPNDVVGVGEQVEVTVLDVDKELKRIALSMVDD